LLIYLRKYSHYLLDHKKALYLGFFAMVLTNIFGVAKPLILKSAIDDLEKEFQWEKIIYLALFIVVLAVFQGIFRFIQRWHIISASRRAEYHLRKDFISHLQNLSLEYYDKNATGDIMARATSDIAAVRMALGPGFMHLIDTVIVGSFALVMMLSISVKLTLAAFSIFPFISLVVYWIGKKSHLYHNRVQESFSTLNTFAQENIAGVRVVKSFAIEESQISRFFDHAKDYYRKNMDLVKVQATFIPLLYFILGFGILLIIWLGGRGIIEEKMTLGGFAAFIAYLMMLAWPMVSIGWVVNIFQRAEASMERVDKIMSAEPEVREHPDAEDLPDNFQPTVEIKNLDYGYNENSRVLTGINLKIGAGESIGIVGSVGSGKSTLVKLIPRLYNAPENSIFIDSIPVEKLTLKSLRENIAFIPQDPFLFSETVHENIDFDGVIENDLFLEICRTAGLDNDVRDFSESYETMVGERGITLSGGQKQRISLARGLLIDAPFIILDDALTGVDASTEAEILNNLHTIFADKTVIVVTHRVSTVMNFDKIIVMDEGKIVESGKHEELVAKKAAYFRLYRRQLIENELDNL